MIMKRKMKRQPTEWEKIVVNHISNKGLITRIYTELLRLNKKRQITQLKNGQTGSSLVA